MDKKIPATIVTGFLGSGKTTFLKSVLDRADGKRIAVLVNEFGELGIDGQLLSCPLDCEEESSQRPVYELANGCICCTVQEEFFPVMQQLVDLRHKIDHILIETSGLALPKPLVQAFNWPEIKAHCTVDAVITVVDAPAVDAGMFAANPDAVNQQRRRDPNLDHESALQELFSDQLSAADMVLINKTDQLDDEGLNRVRRCVTDGIAAGVQIYETCHGDVNTTLVLDLNKGVEDLIDQRPSHHDHDHDHDHDVFQSVALQLDHLQPHWLPELGRYLMDRFPIFRMKGIVSVPGKPMRLVFQGVGQRFDHYFDRPWRQDETRGSTLIFIGPGLQQDVLHQHVEQFVADLNHASA